MFCFQKFRLLWLLSVPQCTGPVGCTRAFWVGVAIGSLWGPARKAMYGVTGLDTVLEALGQWRLDCSSGGLEEGLAGEPKLPLGIPLLLFVLTILR